MTILKSLKGNYIYFSLFISGAVILVMEIAGARLMAPFFGSTIFVWSSLITITLGLLAAGYFVGGFLADKYPKEEYFYFIIALGGAAALFLVKLSQPILSFSDRFGFKFGPLVAATVMFAVPIFLLSMAGPFAIRLLSHRLERAGHTSGIVFGVNTAGSLVGALLSGFYLIPYFSLSNIFVFSIAAIMLIAIGGLILSKSPRWMIYAAAALLLLFWLLPFLGRNSGDQVSVLYSKPSFYGNIRVIEHLGQRCLEVNSSGQACVDADNKRQTFPYGQLINNLFGANTRVANRPRHGDLLLLGLGGGVLARDLSGRFDSVDAVDIDPKIVEAARRFFGYDDADTNINTFISDARSFIKNSEKKYDVILVDVFSGANPAAHMFTKEAFSEIKNILAEDGIMAINTIGYAYGEKDILAQSIYKTLNAVFPYNGALTTESVVKNPEGLANIIFISSLDPKGFDIGEEFIVAYKEPAADAHIFTDDKNPIERLSAPIAGQVQESYKNFLRSS